jgi:hypothetical protein
MGRVLSIREFLAALACDAELIAKYVDDPSATMAAAGLSAQEQQALCSGDDRLIHQALARCPKAPGPMQAAPGHNTAAPRA